MLILLVEDDHLQVEALHSALVMAFPGSRINRVATESEFRDWLSSDLSQIPDVIVIDMMLRWADPGPEIPQPPPEVKKNGRYRAGTRCRALLREDPRTREIPVILHTFLERSDVGNLPDAVSFVTKVSDPAQLIEKIRELAG